MPLPDRPTIVNASLGALTVAGVTLLTVRPDHDLSRSAGIVTAVIGAMGAATAIHWTLTDRRLRRVEVLGQRIVTAEQSVLTALQDDGLPPRLLA